MRRQPISSLVLATHLVALAACGGGGPTAPPPPRQSIAFTPATTAPAANSVSLRQRSGTATTLSLDVSATSVTDVASVAFDLVFNPAVIQCASATAGGLLGSGGGSVSFLLPPNVAAACAAGRLPVGITINPALTGVSGSGVLCTVNFESVASGSDSIRFENAATLHPRAVPNPGVSFEGGTVQISR